MSNTPAARDDGAGDACRRLPRCFFFPVGHPGIDLFLDFIPYHGLLFRGEDIPVFDKAGDLLLFLRLLRQRVTGPASPGMLTMFSCCGKGGALAMPFTACGEESRCAERNNFA